jgi:hypothetical protein
MTSRHRGSAPPGPGSWNQQSVSSSPYPGVFSPAGAAARCGPPWRAAGRLGCWWPIVRPTVMPPSKAHRNIAHGRRLSISRRSMTSSFGFRAAANASAKNSEFIAGHPASVIVPDGWRVPTDDAARGAADVDDLSLTGPAGDIKVLRASSGAGFGHFLLGVGDGAFEALTWWPSASPTAFLMVWVTAGSTLPAAEWGRRRSGRRRPCQRADSGADTRRAGPVAGTGGMAGCQRAELTRWRQR